MTDKIVSLFTGQSTDTPNAQVVAVLADLLEQAKTGELQSFAFASQCSDGAMVTGFTDSTDVFAMIGALRLVEYKLLGGIEV